MKLKAPDDTLKRRHAEYPSVQRQLDTIWKALQEVKGKPFSTEVQAMIDQMAAVDAKYPKR